MNRNIIRWIVFVIFGLQITAKAQSYDAVLLNQNTEIRITNGKLIRVISYDIQINNRVGEKYTEVDIPYSKLLRVSKIDATIKDVAGNKIKKLQSSDITSRSAISNISLYEDNMMKEFTLKHNVYPYVLSYSYQEQIDEFLYVDYWCPVLKREIPTLKATLSVVVPLDYKIIYKNSLVDLPVIDTLESGLKYFWTTKYAVLDEPDVLSPDISCYLPHVKIVPSEFVFKSKGSFESWQSYGNWQYQINRNLDILPDTEKAIIGTLIKDISDRNEKIKVLYHYLQDATRYINISIETGGMIPFPASYVPENKYGDCKALSNYFKSVLKFAGIDAYYCKVHAGDKILVVEKDFPSQQFNHIILCVPNENDTIWLDCTNDGPFNYLGTFTQGREVLFVDRENSRLVKTPALKPCAVEETRQIYIKQLSENSCRVDFITKLKGELFEQLSQIARGYKLENQRLIIRNNYIAPALDLLDFQLQPAHRDSLFINFNYQTKTDKLFQKYGNELIIRTIPFDIPKFKKTNERKYPVQIDIPISKTETQVYVIPDSYFVNKLPLNEAITSEFGKYRIEIEKDDNEIRIFKTFVLYSGIHSLTKYAGFYEFIKKVVDKENNTIIITSKK